MQCVRILIESTPCLLTVKFIYSLLFWKSTKWRDISHLLCLLHEMLLHYINMTLTNDITCRSFLYKGRLVFSMITVIPLYICFALKWTKHVTANINIFIVKVCTSNRAYIQCIFINYLCSQLNIFPYLVIFLRLAHGFYPVFIITNLFYTGYYYFCCCRN